MQTTIARHVARFLCLVAALPLTACSSSVSISPDTSRVVAPGAVVGGLLGPLVPASNPPLSPNTGAPGRYLVSNPNTVATPCTIILNGQPNGVEGTADTQYCPAFSPVLGITAWRLDSGTLLIYKGQELAARLQQRGTQGFEGTVNLGPAPVAMTLTRQ